MFKSAGAQPYPGMLNLHLQDLHLGTCDLFHFCDQHCVYRKHINYCCFTTGNDTARPNQMPNYATDLPECLSTFGTPEGQEVQSVTRLDAAVLTKAHHIHTLRIGHPHTHSS